LGFLVCSRRTHADRGIGSAFIGSSGSWRKIYRGIFFASVLYSFASEALNAAIARGAYKTGGIYDLPFLASALAFLGVALAGSVIFTGSKRCLPAPSPGAGRLAAGKIGAVFSAPPGILGAVPQPRPLYLRHIRLVVTMSGVAVLAFFVFSQATLAGPKTSATPSAFAESFDNLQRLQGRVIQQAKLASLGELVALAASELDHPLSAILSNSERMAASSSLSREQLATAQKIGQQAAEPANSSTIC